MKIRSTYFIIIQSQTIITKMYRYLFHRCAKWYGLLIVLFLFGIVYTPIQSLRIAQARSTEDFREVPASVTAFSEADIASGRIRDISDISLNLPKFTPSTQTNINPSNNIQIRGVGHWADGINIDRIDVFAGAQPSLYGSGTTTRNYSGLQLGWDGRTLPELDAPRDIIVLQQPIYGSIGGVITVVTKPGSKSSATAYLPDDWQLGSSTSLNIGIPNIADRGFDAADDGEFESGFTVGGPIIKDKIWFFGNYSLTRNQGDLGASDFDWKSALPRFSLKNVPDNILPQSASIFGIAFTEKNELHRSYTASDTGPNDPLYTKKDISAGSSVVKKGIGSLLKLGSGGSIGFGSSGDDGPRPSNQWGLLKVGYTPHADPQSAWNEEDGSKKNVAVAVIDSGLDFNHVDGPRYVWTNSKETPGNNIDDDGNGYVDDIHGWNFVDENNELTDDYGHGTFVTGIIAAKTNNKEGIAAINPGARIMVLKASNKNGKSRRLAIYRAVRYAVDNGARVINISLGSKGISRLEQIAINYAYAHGCFVVVAAGNEEDYIAKYSPPGLRRAFAVAAINADGKRRRSSNYGPNVALTAPGAYIYSLTAENGKADGVITPKIPTKYHRLSGTSFSAPMVAGTASLILAKYLHLTNRKLEDVLLNSAMDLAEPGWDRYNGMGVLNASQAFARVDGELLTVRPTQVFLNKKKRRVISIDLYGIIRGNIDEYVVEIGKGEDPDDWQQVFGPAQNLAEYSHICRIAHKILKSGREWTVRITAKSKEGKSKMALMLVRKD